MKYLPDGQSMKAADKDTIENLNIPSLDLMERAAERVVRVIRDERIDLSEILVICGSGNNGGDGFAIARMFKDAGCHVTVFMAGNPAHCSSECQYQKMLYESKGGTVVYEYPDGTYSVIVDAIFGVGLSREVEGTYRDVIERMNTSVGTKVAVDIPSGIDSGNGCVLGVAFKADITVTFQAQKLGLFLYPGKEYAGRVFIEDIGISLRTMDENENVACALDDREYAALLPKRPADSNKGSFGKLLVIAGSEGMSGAAFLNAAAAYRVGAGLVKIYTEESNRIILQTLLPEAIIDTYIDFEKEKVKALLEWADAVCIGSGIGMHTTSKKILKTVLKNVKVPCLVDADGLNLIAKHLEYTECFSEGIFVLTPHMKEMSMLSGLEIAEIKRNRNHVLSSLSQEWNVTCVLKDSRTMIASQGERTVVNTSGCQALAKGGSGDVLSGVIAGLMAQGLSVYDAAVLGVYLHGRSGEIAAKEQNMYSVLARDLLNALAKIKLA